MLTLSYGFKKPENGDKGGVFFPALSANMQLLNDHTHNGSDSARLTTAGATALTSTAAAASWSATSGGTYRQTITLPAGLSYDTVAITARLSTGEIVHPTIEKVSSTQYRVYTNDNSKTYTMVYAS